MVTVALGQCYPRTAQPQQALAALREMAATARARGADLLVVPEMFLTGYAIGAETVARFAQTAGGEFAAAIAEIAHENHVAVVCGLPERSAEGEIFNSAVFVDETGMQRAIYRKLHLFKDVDAAQFSPGQQRPPVLRWRGWGVGLAICYDIEFPEMVRMLAEDGADLICAPTANMVGYEQVTRVLLPARAYESQVYIAYANYCGADDRFSYCGLSAVAAPNGALSVVAGAEGESVVVARLDRAELERMRGRVSYLQDRRTDIYTETADAHYVAGEPER